MGVILSHLSNSGEFSWYFLLSLLQVEYRRWIFTHILRRGRKSCPAACTSETARMSFTESVSTQTRLSVAETCISFCLDDTVGDPFLGSDSQGTADADDVSSSGNSSGGPDDDDAGDSREASASSSPSPSEYGDICIFESPDFTQFGQHYSHLASPRDRLQRPVTPRALRISSLSPVKEEAGSDHREHVEKPGPGEEHDDTFLVFDDDDEDEDDEEEGAGAAMYRDIGAWPEKPNLGRQRLWGVSQTPERDDSRYEYDGNTRNTLDLKWCDAWTRDEDGIGSRTTCRSFSSDSGIGEGLSRSANTSISDGHWLSASATNPHHHSHSYSDYNEAYDEVFSEEDTVYDSSRYRVSARADAEETRVINRSTELKSLQTGGRSISDFQSSPLVPAQAKAKRKVTFFEDVAVGSAPPSTPFSSSASFSVLSSATSSYCSSTSSFTKGWRASPVGQEPPDSGRSGSSDDCDTPATLCPPPSPFSFEQRRRYFAEPAGLGGRDLVLRAQGERFHVHGSVLAWQCHALRAHLVKAAPPGSRPEVILEDRCAEDVLHFLCLLYPFGQEVTGSIVEGVLGVAHHLGCDTVTCQCVTHLLRLSHLPHLCQHLAAETPDCGDEVDNFSGSGSNNSSEEWSRFPPLSGNMRAATSITANQQPARLCACADSMADRVADILQMAVKYGLHEVYDVYTDVAAGMTSERWVTCARYDHLSARTREDILRARIVRLENVVNHLAVTRSSLIGCRKNRHEGDRVSINGVCLRCTSRQLLREAKESVGMPSIYFL